MIEYAYAESGATLIRVNEVDRVCLTRTIRDTEPTLDMGTGWQAAFNIITSTCDVRDGLRARVKVAQSGKKMRVSTYLLTLQRIEHADLNSTDKPKSYSQYDGTNAREHMRDEYPLTREQIAEAWSSMRGKKGYAHGMRSIIDDSSADKYLLNNRYKPEIYS